MNDSEPVHFGASFKTLSTTHSFSNLGSLKSSTPKVFSYRESFEKLEKITQISGKIIIHPR